MCRAGASCAVLALSAGTADAADPPATMPVKASAAPAGYDWTGFYVGGHVGLATGNSPWNVRFPWRGGAPVPVPSSLYQPPNGFTEGGSWFEGVQGGYNLMLRNCVVLGIEGDGSFPAFPDTVGASGIGGISNFTSPNFGAGTFSETVLASGTLRGRIGYAPGHWLFYATGGLAWSYDQTNPERKPRPATTEDRFLYRFGWAAGARHRDRNRTKLDRSWRISLAESDPPDATVNFPAGGTTCLLRSSPNINSVSALNYRFDDPSRPASAWHRRASWTTPIFLPCTPRPPSSTRPTPPSPPLPGNEQPHPRRRRHADLRHHLVCRRQTLEGRRVLDQSGNRPRFWPQQYPRGGRFPQRRSLQDGLGHALCAAATRLPAPDHRSRRRHRKRR